MNWQGHNSAHSEEIKAAMALWGQEKWREKNRQRERKKERVREGRRAGGRASEKLMCHF